MSGVPRLTYATNRPVGFDGLQANERTVLEHWDRDTPVIRIAELTGFSRRFVTDTLTKFAVTAHEPWKDDARQGSAALLAALRHHYPTRCGVAS